MTYPSDLPVLLAGVRAGVLDPDRVGELLPGWDAATHPRLVEFLLARGALSADDLRRLEGGVKTVDQSTPRTAWDVESDGLTPEDEVDELLAGHLDETPSYAAGPDTDGPPTPLPAGPRYRPLRPHRGGGLGQVWLALDTVLGRVVALKVLRADRRTLAGVRQRFVAEAKAAGRLEHPNIVPVYDLLPPGPDRPDPAYVMRFVAGRTLTEAAQEYHRTAARGVATRAALAPLLDAFVLVCRAVAFAHSRGVLHRDLKGANVLLGEYGEVQLLDWGLAKPAGAEAVGPPPAAVVDPEDSDLTVTGGVVGTPAYVAPEVAAVRPASVASDVYGLGATLYAVLAGRTPFDGPTPQAVLDRVRAAAPPPPRAVNPKVPAALNAVVLRAMSRDPVDRYPSAEALAKDVRDWLADEPVAAYREPLTARLARRVRRHRTLAVAAGLGLLTVAVGATAAAALLARERERTARAAGQAEQAADALEEQTRRQLATALDRMPPGAEAEWVKQELVGEVADGYDRLARLRPDRPPPELGVGRLHRYAGYCRLNQFRPADAVRHFQRGVDLAAAGEPAHARRDLARALLEAGRLAEADDLLATVSAPDDPADRWHRPWLTALQARVAFQRGDRDRCRRLAAEALAGFAAAPDPPQMRRSAAVVERLACHALVVDALREAGDLEAALDASRKGAELVDHPALKDDPGGLLGREAASARAAYIRTQAAVAGRRPATRAAAARNLDRAVTAFTKLATAWPRHPAYAAELAETLVERAAVRAEAEPAAARADLADALARAEQLAAAHPEPPLPHRLVGDAAARLAAADPAGGWRAKARAAYQAAAAREPDNPRHRAAAAAAAD